MSACCRRPQDETTQYKINANYPAISGGKLFRFDWFILFLQLVVLGIVSIGAASSLLRQVGPPVPFPVFPCCCLSLPLAANLHTIR